MPPSVSAATRSDDDEDHGATAEISDADGDEKEEPEYEEVEEDGDVEEYEEYVEEVEEVEEEEEVEEVEEEEEEEEEEEVEEEEVEEVVVVEVEEKKVGQKDEVNVSDSSIEADEDPNEMFMPRMILSPDLLLLRWVAAGNKPWAD